MRNGFRPQLGRLKQLTAARTALALSAAAGLLVVAGTAGYGLAKPPAGQSLQGQIELGARLSAATQVQQPQFPWWQRPGLLTFAFPYHAPFQVTGSAVVAIGDSVMLASAPDSAPTARSQPTRSTRSARRSARTAG